MKICKKKSIKHVVVILLSLVVLGIYAKSTYATSNGYNITWADEIESNYWEKVEKVDKTTDNGIIAVGYTTASKISAFSGLITKYSSTGTREWLKILSDEKDNTDVTFKSVKTVSEGYIAVRVL